MCVILDYSTSYTCCTWDLPLAISNSSTLGNTEYIQRVYTSRNSWDNVDNLLIKTRRHKLMKMSDYEASTKVNLSKRFCLWHPHANLKRITILLRRTKQHELKVNMKYRKGICLPSRGKAGRNVLGRCIIVLVKDPPLLPGVLQSEKSDYYIKTLWGS